MQTNQVSFFIVFCIHTRHLCFGVLSFFFGGICTSFWFFTFPSSLPDGSLFGAHFSGIGLGILPETCDSPDDEGVDTSSVV
jgi:hypothetical protein